MSFDTILAAIADDAEREQIKTLATKYPAIKQYVELGETAKPVIDKISAMGDTFKPLDELARLPEWVNWREKQHPAEQQRLRDAEAARVALANEKQALSARIAELESGGEVEMTFEEIKAKLAADGLLADKAALDGRVTKDELNQALNSFGVRQQTVFAELDPMAIDHSKKYGEAFPYSEVFAYMQSNQRYDPATKQLVMPSSKEAYEVIVAPKVRQLEKDANEAAVKAAREEGIAAGKQEAMQSVSGRAIPVAGEGQRAGSRFMNRVFERRDADTTRPSRLGDGTATRSGVADHMKKQMAGANNL